MLDCGQVTRICKTSSNEQQQTHTRMHAQNTNILEQLLISHWDMDEQPMSFLDQR